MTLAIAAATGIHFWGKKSLGWSMQFPLYLMKSVIAAAYLGHNPSKSNQNWDINIYKCLTFHST